jgi:phage-related protein
LIWLATSKSDLLALPPPVVDVFGYALYLAQAGRRHESTKVLKGYGDASVLEVIEDHKGSAYRAIYTVRFREAVFVLHVFQKKSRAGVAVPRRDRELIDRRLKLASNLVAQISK